MFLSTKTNQAKKKVPTTEPQWNVLLPVEIIKRKFSLPLFPKEMDQEGGVNGDAVISSLWTIRKDNGWVGDERIGNKSCEMRSIWK